MGATAPDCKGRGEEATSWGEVGRRNSVKLLGGGSFGDEEGEDEVGGVGDLLEADAYRHADADGLRRDVEEVGENTETFLLVQFDEADVVGDLGLLPQGGVHRVVGDDEGVDAAPAADQGPAVRQGVAVRAHGHWEVSELVALRALLDS